MDANGQSPSNDGAPKGELPTNRLSWVDEAGHSIAECREISGIPGTAVAFDGEASGRAISHAKQMMADLFRGSVGTPPGGTLEVVFKPEIKKGLEEGVYALQKTADGETLAIAVNSKRQFAGNARVIQTGQMRRLAVGSYQLISIAVAQAHLSEINDSLERVEGHLEHIKNMLNDSSIGEIQGDISFLKNEVKKMNSMEHDRGYSSEKTHSIQGIARSFYIYMEKNTQNLKTLTREIDEYRDTEFLGTGNSFNDMKERIKKIENLLEKNGLILQLMLAHTIICSWVDPDEVKLSRISYDENSWRMQMEKFKEVVLNKNKEIFGRALTNSNEILSLRKEYLGMLVKEYCKLSSDQQAHYAGSVGNLKRQVSRISKEGAETRFAVSFDTKGEVQAVAVM